MQINLYGVEMDLYGLISVMAAFILAAIIAFFINRWSQKIEKAQRADFNKEGEIRGIVDEIRLIDYTPGGLFSFDRPAQTLIMFENGSEITIKGLHLDIKKGQSWIIKYKGTDEWHEIRPLIEKKMF